MVWASVARGGNALLFANSVFAVNKMKEKSFKTVLYFHITVLLNLRYFPFCCSSSTWFCESGTLTVWAAPVQSGVCSLLVPMLQTPLSGAWCCPLIGQYSVTRLLIGCSQGMLQSSMSQSADGLVRYYLWSKASTIATGKWDAHQEQSTPQILFSPDHERESVILLG